MKTTQEKQAAGRRLKEARAKHFRSAREAALANEWSEQTVRSHENGTREFDEGWAKKYARRYHVTWLYLLHGSPGGNTLPPPPPAPKGFVRLAGLIGAGAEIHPFDDDAGEMIDAPPGLGEEATAYQIDGVSQLPVYGPGDIVFCSSRRSGSAIADLVGLTCAVQVTDGPFFFKTIVPGSKRGTWTLLSHNAEPLLDRHLDWAAFAEWHRVARRPRGKSTRGA